MANRKKLTEAQVVGTSLLVSLSDILLNLIVAIFSGSAVMLSQSLQGLSDLTTAGFLFLGIKRSHNQADSKHPFGYGRELFFWSLMAAVVMFIGTGGLSLYFGYQQIVRPNAVEHLPVALAVLVFGLYGNSFSLSRSVRRIRESGTRITGLRSFFGVGLIETKTTLFVDFMGTLGAVFGLLSLGLYYLTDNAVFDGIGAVAIGLLTMLGAIVIMIDIKELITGRTVSPEIAGNIRRAAMKVAGVRDVLDLRTVYVGSTNLLVILEVHLEDEFTTDDIERILDKIKVSVQHDIPEARHIQIEVETPDSEITVTKAAD